MKTITDILANRVTELEAQRREQGSIDDAVKFLQSQGFDISQASKSYSKRLETRLNVNIQARVNCESHMIDLKVKGIGNESVDFESSFAFNQTDQIILAIKEAVTTLTTMVE